MSYYCFFLALLGGIGLTSATVFDKALTSATQSAFEMDTILFSFRHIRPLRRTPSNAHQVLLSIVLPSHHRLAVILDRLNGQFVLESTISGDIDRRELDIQDSPLHETIDSVLVEMTQKSRIANIYIECHLVGSVTLPMSLKDMIPEDISEVRVYRDRNTEVNIDWSINVLEMLEKLNCRNGQTAGDRQSQSNEIYTYRRGDIPVTHEDEKASVLVKSLSELIETIRELQVEIQTQREETALLRDTIANCEACKPGRDF